MTSVGTSSLAREALAAAWAAQGRSVDPNVYRALASHPRALPKLVEFGTVVYFDNSMTRRELAYLTASLTNDCHY
jgi:alkylhydroperoxidase family enzyme